MGRIEKAKNIHLIGIGGCSMSGIARILAAQGYQVSGSDREPTQFTRTLDACGIPYHIGQKAENVEGADLVIYSAAIKETNPERAAAAERGIPQMERSEALGEISGHYAEVVAVAGCHGKTTITSMLALISRVAGLDATVHVGGYVDFLDGGVEIGGEGLFITEACEYVESFLTLRPTIALVSNIDNDHLDYYRDIDAIEDAFRKFLGLLPESGTVVACAEDERVMRIAQESGKRVRTYGLGRGEFSAERIAFDEKGSGSFDLVRNGIVLGRVSLSVPGTHSILNAVGAYAVADLLGVDFEKYRTAMEAFSNTRRRFEFYGERNGVRIFHDYGHHPSEIAATMEAASHVPHGKLYCVFQCNSYTRAKTLFTGTVRCFEKADAVLVPDIYPGRETDDGTVHARDMVDAINRTTGNAVYLGTFEAIRTYLDEHAQPGDMVVTVGSGDVYRQTGKLLEK